MQQAGDLLDMPALATEAEWWRDTAELWDLRAKYAAAPPWEPERDRTIMTELAEQLTEIVAAERAALDRLRDAVGPG